METPTQDSPPVTLQALAEAAQSHRLSPADEEKAAALLSEQLKAGRAGITAAIEPLLAFSWIVSVNAIAAVWSDLSLPMQRFLNSSLAKVETEQARRLRLSMARAVYKLDPAAGTRMAIAVAGDLKNPESGTLSTRSRQLFFHVFVGKGKPWVCQLSLEGAKGADALVHSAAEVLPLSPPLSQLSLLRWIHASGRFKKLTEAHLAQIAKSVSRWNYRLQQSLKADVPDLPEVITAVLKPERTEQKPEAPEKKEAASEETPSEAAEESGTEEKAAVAEVTEETPVAENAESTESEGDKEEKAPRLSREERQAARRRERDARRDEQREQREQRRREREKEAEAAPESARSGAASQRDASPRERERSGRTAFDPKTFDLRDTLRHVESYVASLRQELDQTKTQLRRKDDESINARRARRNSEDAKPAVDPEELTRHNARLESTIEELRQQLEDLAGHHEAIAQSRELHGDEPLPEGSADQLRTLLNIKLHESYETFLEMKQDPLDRVFRLHYRDLLGHVFEILQQQGVSLQGPTAKTQS